MLGGSGGNAFGRKLEREAGHFFLFHAAFVDFGLRENGHESRDAAIGDPKLVAVEDVMFAIRRKSRACVLIEAASEPDPGSVRQ